MNINELKFSVYSKIINLIFKITNKSSKNKKKLYLLFIKAMLGREVNHISNSLFIIEKNFYLYNLLGNHLKSNPEITLLFINKLQTKHFLTDSFVIIKLNISFSKFYNQMFLFCGLDLLKLYCESQIETTNLLKRSVKL